MTIEGLEPSTRTLYGSVIGCVLIPSGTILHLMGDLKGAAMVIAGTLIFLYSKTTKYDPLFAHEQDEIYFVGELYDQLGKRMSSLNK